MHEHAAYALRHPCVMRIRRGAGANVVRTYHKLYFYAHQQRSSFIFYFLFITINIIKSLVKFFWGLSQNGQCPVSFSYSKLLYLHPIHIEKCRQLHAVCKHAKTCLHSVHVSLCICLKNQQISVCDKRYANRPQMAQRRFAVPSTHTRIWFANCLRAVCKLFGALVYTMLKVDSLRQAQLLSVVE